MNKKITIGLIVLIVITAGAGIAYKYFPSSKQIEVKLAPKAALTVEVKNPFFQELPLKIDVTGNVSAWQESIIGSEIAGIRIESILVDVGDSVTKGQVLATLKSETIQSDLNQSKASLMEAQANLEQAKENANRARTLDKTNALSSQQMSQYLTTETIAKARVESAKANMETQNVRLNQTKILAPDSGLISSRIATVGSIVGQNELFRLIIQEKLQWKPQISSDQIDKIKIGQDVEIKTKNHEVITSKITQVSPLINEQTRQGTIFVDLNKDVHLNKIKAGMFLDGSISIGNANIMLIDQQAVILRDGFYFVFILTPENKVNQTRITIGRHFNNNIEILSGVTNNDQLVITGATFLRDQDVVNVVKETK